MVVIDAQECTGCGNCADVCPLEAISIVDGVAKVDPDVCSDCLTCVDECPVEAIAEE